MTTRPRVVYRLGVPCALALGVGVVLSLYALGQTSTPLVANQAQADALLVVFQQQQQLIAQAFNDLMLQGPTPEEIYNWQQENAAVFADQQLRAVALGTYSSAQPLAYVNEVDIPSDATQEMSDFLTVRANLYNSYARLHNQVVSEPNGTTSSDRDVQAAYQTDNAAEIRAQAQRAQDLAAQSARQPIPIPPPLVIAPGTPQNMWPFLTLRDQLMRGRVALWNQYIGASAADRDAALEQWQQQNAASFQELQHLAQKMSQPNDN